MARIYFLLSASNGPNGWEGSGVSSNLKGSRLKVCLATWVLVNCRCSQVDLDWQSHSLHPVSDSHSPCVGLVLIILAVVSVVSKNLLRMCFVVIHWCETDDVCALSD